MIKNILKQSGLTQSQFAADLNISRPTLDSYIDIYDNGSKINNPFYQDVFDFLFENPYITDQDFIKRYTYMRNFYGLSNNETQINVSKLKSTYDSPKNEYEKIMDEIESILGRDRTNQKNPIELYRLIHNALKTGDKSFMEVFKFHSILQGVDKLDIVLDEKTKKLYANLYKALKDSQDINLSFDNKYFDEFVDAANKAYNDKHEKIERIIKSLNDKISEALYDELKNIELSNVDMNQIISIIKKKI